MDQPTDVYASMGIAAMLPGLTRALELMQAEVDNLRAMLQRAQAGQPLAGPRRGRPPKVHAANGAVPFPTAAPSRRKPHKYWAAMTQEQRSEEMKRRGMVGKKTKKRSGAVDAHPRDPRHPKHAAWVKKIAVAKAAAAEARVQ